MSLLERSAALSSGARDLHGLRSAANQADALRSRADTFSADLLRLKACCSRRRLLAAHGITVEAQADAAPGIARFARELEASIEQAPASVLSPELQVAPRLSNPLRALIKTLDAAVLAAWQAHVQGLAPGIRSDLLDVLWRIPGLRRQVEVVRDLWRRLESLSTQAPSTDEDVRLASIVAGELVDAWRELDATEMPAEVLVFLKGAVAPSGADLALFTPPVAGWLAAHGLTMSFKVAAR